MQDISVIILTYNEERHIRRALENARLFAKEIFVVDSFSTDRTVEIAREKDARVYQHEFVTHSAQLRWALEHLPIQTQWVCKQDADEYLTDTLIAEIDEVLPTLPEDVNGLTAPCLRKFMGRYIKHGIVPLILLRLFKFRFARIENKLMDEHIWLTEGKVGALHHAFFDDSLMTLTEWTHKHNGYATREAIELLCIEYGIGQGAEVHNMGDHSAKIRERKLKYLKLPIFWRAFAFFVYRYIFRLGFLDGKEGFLWHFLQGWWYRTLADAKVYEIKKRCQGDAGLIQEEIHRLIAPLTSTDNV